MAEYFNELFDQWSADYDFTVNGGDIEYSEVFNGYDAILQTIAERTHGSVIEFGVGTGNLTSKLLQQGIEVVGVEPSEKMRMIAQSKLPNTKITNGNFLMFPFMDQKVDGIVSSYAFHHLTDEEKNEAIALYAKLLNKGGKIVFGDTIFTDETAKEAAQLDAKEKGFHRLAEDLQREFYTTIPVMNEILEAHGFKTKFEKLNDFVWLIEAEK